MRSNLTLQARVLPFDEPDETGPLDTIALFNPDGTPFSVPGSENTPGPRGEKGDTGEKGETGEQGPVGQDGTPGLNGVDGDPGLDGLNGADGQDGVAGTNGTNGTNGVDGVNGEQGLRGLPGIDGLDGSDGVDGTNGVDGQQGPPGVAPSSSDVATTFTAVTAAASVTGAVDLGKGYRINKLVANRPCRVRAYMTAADRTADASRLRTVDPTGDHGLIFEAFFTSGLLTTRCSPQVFGTVAGSTFLHVTNDGTTGDVVFTITRQVLEP